LQDDGITGFLTTGANNLSTVFAGTISGLANSILTKIGTGTQTLSGNNTYGGPTTINGGVLSISNDANPGTAPARATPGQLVIDGGTLQTTATFTLNANRGIALGPTSGSGGGTIDVANSTTLSYGGVIADNSSDGSSGSGGLTKVGTGRLVLAG